MLFSKALVGNSRVANDLWQEVQNSRNATYIIEEMHQEVARRAGFAANEGFVPRDTFIEFDKQGVERFRADDGDVFLNDMIPLSQSTRIGKILHAFRQVSDAGVAQTSISGQVGIVGDQTEHSYDATLVPIHDSAFYRKWREFDAMSSEGFDALIDDQRETVATLREKIVDSFLDGHVDKNGNTIVFNGYTWAGVRNDTRVGQVDLGAGGVNFDFTDNGQLPTAVKAAFIEVRDTLWITNNCTMDATYYISREMASNFERKWSTSFDSKTIIQELESLMGVAQIKVTSKMSGNEFMAFPLNRDKIKPIMGMGVNTVAMPRQKFNDDYMFVTWAAIGWQVRTDYNGLTCVIYASE